MSALLRFKIRKPHAFSAWCAFSAVLPDQLALSLNEKWMHGGKSTGPPKGNQNALKHGFYTQDAVLEREYIKKLLEEAKAVISSGLS